MESVWYLIAFICHGLYCADPQYIGTFYTELDCAEVLGQNIQRTPDPKEGQVLLCLDSEHFNWPMVDEERDK